MRDAASQVLHPAWLGLWLSLPAWLCGVFMGSARACLDRAFFNPARIAATMCYHVGFTALIATTGLLGFFEFVIHAIVHKGAIVSLWPWFWCGVLAYGATCGYAWVMCAFKRVYLERVRRRGYRDDLA